MKKIALLALVILSFFGNTETVQANRTAQIQHTNVLVGFTNGGSLSVYWPGYGRTVFTDPKRVGTDGECWVTKPATTQTFDELRRSLVLYGQERQLGDPELADNFSFFPFVETDEGIVFGTTFAYARFVDCGAKLGGVWLGQICVDLFPFYDQDAPGYDYCGFVSEVREMRSEDVSAQEIVQHRTKPAPRKKVLFPWLNRKE